MYSRDFNFTIVSLVNAIAYSAMTITTTDSTVEGSDAFTFTFTTTNPSDFIVIQVPSVPYYPLTT